MSAEDFADLLDRLVEAAHEQGAAEERFLTGKGSRAAWYDRIDAAAAARGAVDRARNLVGGAA